MSSGRGKDDALTVVAIAALAYMLADVAHECIGHGIGFVLAGGHSAVFTTTRLIPKQPPQLNSWRIFDLGGPGGNLTLAACAFIAQRMISPAHSWLRFFIWLCTSFSLFWASGYLMYSAILGRGDWLALLPGHATTWPYRLLLFVAGVLLYWWTIRLVARENCWAGRIRRLAWHSYLAGGVIACAGAVLDPNGPQEVLYSGAVSSFLASLGLLASANLAGKSATVAIESPILSRSVGWILASAAAALFYCFILGRGLSLQWK